MDFSYDRPSGIPASSPFHFATIAASLDEPPKKRQHAETWESRPAASAFRPPDNNSFLFSTPKSSSQVRQQQKPNPFLFQKQSFTTPRPTSGEILSDVATTSPDTPQGTADDDEATPENTDTGGENDMQIIRSRSKSPSKFGPRFRKDTKSALSTLAVRKIRKRRMMKERDFWTGNTQEDEEDDLSDNDTRTGQRLSMRSRLAQSVLGWNLSRHREISYIASGYLQLGFNFFLVSVLLYLIYGFVRTIQRDVDLKVDEYSAGTCRFMIYL
jgi:hypothetical protein